MNVFNPSDYYTSLPNASYIPVVSIGLHININIHLKCSWLINVWIAIILWLFLLLLLCIIILQFYRIWILHFLLCVCKFSILLLHFWITQIRLILPYLRFPCWIQFRLLSIHFHTCCYPILLGSLRSNYIAIQIIIWLHYYIVLQLFRLVIKNHSGCGVGFYLTEFLNWLYLCTTNIEP